MDNPFIIIAVIVALLVIGFYVYTKVAATIMKIGFLLVTIIVFLILFHDKLPFP